MTASHPEPLLGPHMHLTQVAVGEEVVRCPENIGLPTVHRLLSDPQDRALLGPVVHDTLSGRVYFWTTAGAAGGWPADCQILAAGAWVGLPTRSSTRVIWLNQPKPARLAGAVWLACALADTSMVQQELGVAS